MNKFEKFVDSLYENDSFAEHFHLITNSDWNYNKSSDFPIKHGDSYGILYCSESTNMDTTNSSANFTFLTAEQVKVLADLKNINKYQVDEQTPKITIYTPYYYYPAATTDRAHKAQSGSVASFTAELYHELDNSKKSVSPILTGKFNGIERINYLYRVMEGETESRPTLGSSFVQAYDRFGKYTILILEDYVRRTNGPGMER